MLAYVGGYSSPDRRGRADGITVWQVDHVCAPWTKLATVPAAENPSLLRAGPGGGVIYVVHGARTLVSAYAREPDGQLRLLGTADSGGANPVDCGVVPGGDALVVANYGGGTVALLPLDAAGTPSDPVQVVALTRDGIGASALPHGVTFDPTGRFVLVPDKGLDAVFVFRCDGGRLAPSGFGAAAPGSGPRHAVFHPTLPVLYAVCELACTVQPFQWDPASFALAAMPPAATLAVAHDPRFASAEIAISADGAHLYASTRGHDHLAHFAVEPASGALTLVGSTPCLGREPRLFVLAPGGGALVCANQESDEIVSFPIGRDGALGAGRVVARAGSPSAICLVAA